MDACDCRDYRYAKDIVYNNFPWPLTGGHTGPPLRDGENKVTRAPLRDEENKVAGLPLRDERNEVAGLPLRDERNKIAGLSLWDEGNEVVGAPPCGRPQNTPNPHISKIEKTAQAIRDARLLYPECSLAGMCGDKMYLFPELLKAHQQNDCAVMQAYGFDIKTMTESQCAAELMRMYRDLMK